MRLAATDLEPSTARPFLKAYVVNSNNSQLFSTNLTLPGTRISRRARRYEYVHLDKGFLKNAEGVVQKSPKPSSRTKRPVTRTESQSTLSMRILPISTSSSWTRSNPHPRSTSNSRSISRRPTAVHTGASLHRRSSMHSVWRGTEKMRPGVMEGMTNLKMARGCCCGMVVDQRTSVVRIFPIRQGPYLDVSLLHRYFESRVAYRTSRSTCHWVHVW